MANGVDGEILLPIKFTVEDDKAVEQGIERLKAKLRKLEETKKSGKVSMDDSKEIQKSIDKTKEYIQTIEEARDKMAKLKDIARKKSDLAESLKGEYKGAEKGSAEERAVSIANAQATKANANLIVQGTQLKNVMQDAYDAAVKESEGINSITAAVEVAIPKVDLLKQSMQSFQQTVDKGIVNDYYTKHGLAELESTLNKVKLAYETTENEIDRQYNTEKYGFVKVDPDATVQLTKVSQQMATIAMEIQDSDEYLQHVQALITNGQVEQALEAKGISMEKFTADVAESKAKVEDLTNQLMELAKTYHLLASAAAANAIDVKSGVVTYASDDMPKTAKKWAADREAQRKAEEEARLAAEQAEKAREEEAKAAKRANQERIKQLQREMAEVKKTASQYYYKLRAVKMLGFTIKSVSSAINNMNKKMISGATKALVAYSKLIPGVNALRRAFDKSASSQNRFNKRMKETSKSTNVGNTSLSKFVITTLKAVIGVRSLYMLLRKLRRAVGEGFESMALQLDDVNAQLSSIVTNLNYMKASVTAVVQPILNALAPALERIADLVDKVSYKVSSFIAILTGQDYVYRAIKVQTNYANSLDKTAKSAKDAAKELGKYDKLEVLKKDKDTDNTGGMQWEKVPLDDVMKDWANKFKNFFDKLFAPLKAAWDKYGAFVMKAWKYALGEIKKLIADIGEDFLRMWSEAATQRIFEELLRIIGDIGLIVGNLAKNFREAWNENDNGYRILSAIRDCIGEIVKYIRKAADYTVEWSSKLSFIPLLNSLADNMEQKLVPAVENVMKLFEVIYEQLVLKIVKDIIEKGLPQIIDLAGKIVEIVGIIADKFRVGLQSGSNGILIIDRAEDLLQIVMDTLQDCVDKTKEWAEGLDFRNLLSQVKQFLEDIAPLVQFISDTFKSFYTDVLLPFWKYLIEGDTEGKGGIPGALAKLGEVVQSADWEAITENMHNLMDALAPFFELAWEVLTQLIVDLMSKILEFAASEEFGTLIDKFKDWVTNADPEELASKIETLVGVIIGATAAFNLLSKVVFPLITNYMTIVNFIKQGSMSSQIAKLSKDVATLAGTGTGETATGLAGLAAKAEHIIQVIKVLPEAFQMIQQPFTVVTGALTALAGIFVSLTSGFKMMEEGFSIVGEAATLFGAVLTGIGLIVAGVGAWPALIVAALVAIVANLGAFGDDIYNWALTTATEITTKIGEFFHNLGHNLGVWVGTAIKNLGSLLKDALKTLSKPENWLEFGINILKGILGIFLSVGRLFEWIVTAIANFFSGFVDGLKDAFDMHSPSKKMEEYGINILKGILEGMLSVIKTIGTWVKKNIFEPIVSAIKLPFKIVSGASSVLLDVGKTVINGLKNGLSLSQIWSNIKSAVTSKISTILNTFKSKLNASSLISIGKNVISGLKEGITNGLSNLLSTVKDVGQSVLDTFKDIFSIASPSKETKKIGEFVSEGFEDGIEDGASDVDKLFKDSFLDSLNSMRTDAIDIVSSMIDELNDKMSALTFMDNFTAKLNSMQIPGIATGHVLPSSADFKSSSSMSSELSMMRAMQDAVVSALSNATANSNNQPIVIQLDKRTIAEAVWDEENKRYKQRGAYNPTFA